MIRPLLDHHVRGFLSAPNQSLKTTSKCTEMPTNCPCMSMMAMFCLILQLPSVYNGFAKSARKKEVIHSAIFAHCGMATIALSILYC